jgi:hypothetical protein
VKFLDLFEKVLLEEEYILKKPNSSKVFVELSLDFFAKSAYSLPKADGMPERHIEADYILIPILDGVQTEQDAAKLILAAGTDRNMVVYDDESKSGEFSLRLVHLMKQAAKRYGGSVRSGLTDLFISKKIHITEEEVYGVKIHSVDTEFWDMLERFYKDSLGGDYGENSNLDKANIVIGVDNNRDCFVRPVRVLNGNEGLAILSNQKVLLGFI